MESETLAMILNPYIFLSFFDFNPKDKKLYFITIDKQTNFLIIFERNENKLSIFDVLGFHSTKFLNNSCEKDQEITHLSSM